ncbi:pregnancy-specific beta-1-glycoprotein 4-like isoform X1 [Rhinoraja longicauda]
MARLPPLTALALFLVVSTGVSLGFTVVPEHNNLNVRVGSDAILTVRPSAAIAGGSWSFKGTTIINWVGKTPLIHVDYSSRVKVSYTTGTLALETVTEQDSGDYIVTVNEQGTNIQASATIKLLALGVSLGFTVVPEHNNLNVRVGSDAILTVRPSAAIAGGSWSFKGTTIINWVGKTPLIHVDYSSRVKVSYTTGTLALETVTEQDSGDYIVTVNEQGTNIQASATIKLLALGGSLGLMVVAEHSNLYVRVGRDAIFAVRPSAAISGGSWSFKGRTIINWIGTTSLIHANYSSRVKISYTTGTLAMETVTERDSGDYIVTVNAQSTSIQASATIKLLALEPVSTPNITASASSLIEYNDTMDLACLATGTDISYTWIGDGSEIANGGSLELSAGNTTLTITGVLRSDGPFVCRASNPVSIETSQPFHLNVFYGPDLPIIIPDPNVPLYNSGTEVTLTCSAESEPSAQLEWFLQGDLVQSGDQLTFPKVSADDSGSYLCSAFNNVTGRFRTSSIQINVQVASTALPETMFCLSPGAIAGIVVGLFAACLISGGCGWLIARKTSGPKATPGTKYNANGSPKVEDTLAANAGNGSAAYENIQDIQQGRRTNAPVGDPTYMELKIDDRSVYDELKR